MKSYGNESGKDRDLRFDKRETPLIPYIFDRWVFCTLLEASRTSQAWCMISSSVRNGSSAALYIAIADAESFTIGCKERSRGT